MVEGATRSFFKITKKNIDVYRNFSFQKAAKIFIRDPVLGCKLVPNVSRSAFTSEFKLIYKTNSLGLRDKEIEDNDKFRIIFLGDSLTFGEGIPYGSRFSDLIEKEIENVYSINAGVPGYGIHQMYLWLKFYGMDLKPNLVICSIIPIDLNRAIYRKLENSPHLLISQQKKNRDESKIKDSNSYSRDIFGYLFEKSYFYSVVKVNLKIMQMLFYLRERDKKVWDEMGEEFDFGRFKITTDEKEEMVKEESSKIFLEVKNICDQAYVQFLVVNIDSSSLPWLSEILAKHNIEYLDLSPQMRKNYKKIKFEIDPHYNATGNRLIADFLIDYISNRYKEKITNF